MSNNQLTDVRFWGKRWEKFTPKSTKKLFFENYIPKDLQGKGKRFIEIGGFPGTYAIFFHQRYGFDSSILDFYMDIEQVHELEKANGLECGTITCIEKDFFKFDSDIKYDFVFSAGFIEHFEDTSDVIRRHVDLVADNGTVFILLPNFRGINGLLQKVFDKENYDAHNIKCMDVKYLKTIMDRMDVQNINVSYIRKNMLWISKAKYPVFSRIVKYFGYFLKLFPIPCRLLSSYILISANKNSN